LLIVHCDNFRQWRKKENNTEKIIVDRLKLAAAHQSEVDGAARHMSAASARCKRRAGLLGPRTYRKSIVRKVHKTGRRLIDTARSLQPMVTPISISRLTNKLLQAASAHCNQSQAFAGAIRRTRAGCTVAALRAQNCSYMYAGAQVYYAVSINKPS